MAPPVSSTMCSGTPSIPPVACTGVGCLQVRMPLATQWSSPTTTTHHIVSTNDQKNSIQVTPTTAALLEKEFVVSLHTHSPTAPLPLSPRSSLAGEFLQGIAESFPPPHLASMHQVEPNPKGPKVIKGKRDKMLTSFVRWVGNAPMHHTPHAAHASHALHNTVLRTTCSGRQGSQGHGPRPRCRMTWCQQRTTFSSRVRMVVGGGFVGGRQSIVSGRLRSVVSSVRQKVIQLAPLLCTPRVWCW